MTKEAEQEKAAHRQTTQSLNLKMERLKIVEQENKRLNNPQGQFSESQSKFPSKKQKTRQSYEQGRFTVSEKDLEKQGGKESVLNMMRDANKVPFPDRIRVPHGVNLRNGTQNSFKSNDSSKR